MEDKIMKIIEKVRIIGKYNTDMKGLVGQPASVKLIEKNGEIILDNISFAWYNTLLVGENKIVLIPEFGHRKTLFEYASWDELLEM